MPDVSEMLANWDDPEIREQLLALLYTELKRIAAGRMRKERPDHTLEPTALVNELFLRLVDQKRVNFRSRAHFLAMASKIMRRILVDHARSRNAGKRGGEAVHVDLEKAGAASAPLDVVELHELLEELAKANPRGASVVELRFYGGLTHDEAAEVLEVDARTVKRDWEMARAWLFFRMRGEAVS